jgi:hypothetical protein
MVKSMEETKQRTWWGRNWLWVVPVGCLGMLGLSVASCAGIIGIGFGIMKQSWACTEGVGLARHNKKVVDLLGEPIETGWMLNGSINESGPSGDADLAIPLSGRRNNGTLYVVAKKRAGEWKFERAEVEVEVAGQRQRIDLLAESDQAH